MAQEQADQNIREIREIREIRGSSGTTKGQTSSHRPSFKIFIFTFQ